MKIISFETTLPLVPTFIDTCPLPTHQRQFMLASAAASAFLLSGIGIFFASRWSDALWRWQDVHAKRPWMDTRLKPDERTKKLLAAMTVEEKVAQLGYGGSCAAFVQHPRSLGMGGCQVGKDPYPYRSEQVGYTGLGFGVTSLDVADFGSAYLFILFGPSSCRFSIILQI